jgi:hypothetical protein
MGNCESSVLAADEVCIRRLFGLSVSIPLQIAIHDFSLQDDRCGVLAFSLKMSWLLWHKSKRNFVSNNKTDCEWCNFIPRSLASSLEDFRSIFQLDDTRCQESLAQLIELSSHEHARSRVYYSLAKMFTTCFLFSSDRSSWSDSAFSTVSTFIWFVR